MILFLARFGSKPVIDQMVLILTFRRGFEAYYCSGFYVNIKVQKPETKNTIWETEYQASRHKIDVGVQNGTSVSAWMSA